MTQEPKKEKDKKEEYKAARSGGDSKKKKEEGRDEESVILMGPAYTGQESAMQPISDILPEPDLFEEEDATQNFYEEPPVVASEIHQHQDHKKHKAGAPRFILGAVFIFIGLVYLGGSLEFFDIVNVDTLEFWPLILIFLGLIVVCSKRVWGKIIGVALALAVIVIVLGALLEGGGIIGEQLSGNIIEEERSVTPFTSIVFLGTGNLIIEQGKEISLIVKADAAIIDTIKAEVLDEELRLSASRSILRRLFYKTEVPTYLVTVVDLEAVYLTGSGSVQSSGINADKLKLSIIGSGNIEINNIEVNEINASLSGSGGYTLSGTTTRQIIHILGSGSYEAPNLKSREAGVRITGSGEVLVNVMEELNAAVDGSGEIRYIGDPLVSEESIEGSGTIVRIQSKMIGAILQNLEILEQLKKIDAVKYPKIEQI